MHNDDGEWSTWKTGPPIAEEDDISLGRGFDDRTAYRDYNPDQDRSWWESMLSSSHSQKRMFPEGSDSWSRDGYGGGGGYGGCGHGGCCCVQKKDDYIALALGLGLGSIGAGLLLAALVQLQILLGGGRRRKRSADGDKEDDQIAWYQQLTNSFATFGQQDDDQQDEEGETEQ